MRATLLIENVTVFRIVLFPGQSRLAMETLFFNPSSSAYYSYAVFYRSPESIQGFLKLFPVKEYC